MSGYHDKRAKEILSSIEYATIATVCEDGKPWNSPVAHFFDSEMNICWYSDKDNQHSQNIRNNENVFIVIYDSTVPIGQGEGVYIQATAVEVSDPDEVRILFNTDRKQELETPVDDFAGDAIRRIYRALPNKYWMNDAEEKDGEFLRDYRIQLNSQ